MIKRLRYQTEQFIPAVVVSDQEDEATCKSYHIEHITWGNYPVTEKWNRAMAYMKSIGVDYVMILGSDDNISTGFYLSTLEQCERGVDLIGVRTFYFYCSHGQYRGKMVRLDRPKAPNFLGIGKTVSSKVLDQCDWTLWRESRNCGMDNVANATLVKYVKTRAEVSGMIVDVKSAYNLNRYEIWAKRLPQINPQEFLKELSNEELQILKTL